MALRVSPPQTPSEGKEPLQSPGTGANNQRRLEKDSLDQQIQSITNSPPIMAETYRPPAPLKNQPV